MVINENQLDEWVRSHAEDAQGIIVELVNELTKAAVTNPRERRFPRRDSISQRGPDGVLDTELGRDPFVPDGRSLWEIGTGLDAGDKATRDYRELKEATPESVRRECTFVFVTPLSGRRGWEYSWKEDAQADWLEKRRQLKEWKDVRVVDGTRLIDWLEHFPAVELWLLEQMGISVPDLQTPEQRWAELRRIGEPPPLIPDLFLANRKAASEKLNGMLSGESVRLQLDTHFRIQMADFVSAHIASFDANNKPDSSARCLIVSAPETWNKMTSLNDPHILVADFELDDSDTLGIRLLERAKQRGHAVVFSGMPGGVPNPNRVPMPNPTSHQTMEALTKAGYNAERARTLSQKSNGNLASLLRCLHNLSFLPEWAQGTDAAELAIAELLGGWHESSDADRVVVEQVSGKDYGEWIGKIREIWLSPGAPLASKNGGWKFVQRYEGWYALGPHLHDEHLDRLRETAVRVFKEKDPALDLPRDKRYAANIYGKTLTHSATLRTGLAESFALLGSHPKALTSSSTGKPEVTARLAVQEILRDGDWELWSTLNDVLPLLAESAPGEFLDAVEKELQGSLFDGVFAQEGSGVTGSNYMTGLLWALETLAWDANYLTRVAVILGELSAKDPGGQWGNRPSHSLSTIFLPWFPQTAAPAARRLAAVATLQGELPEVGWKLLMSLLPQSHQTSLTTRKPAWREIIPEDWSEGTTVREYWDQVAAYAELAMSTAKHDVAKLAELIGHINQLPPPVRDDLLAHLRSDSMASIHEDQRLLLWTKLTDLVSQHRKFANAEWALKADVVDQVAAVAEMLAPAIPAQRHLRLFTNRDFDLYEKTGNFEEQMKRLDDRRQNAVSEIYSAGGLEEVLEFAQAVESPVRVGVSFGRIAEPADYAVILPKLLETKILPFSQFAGGFVWARFRLLGWKWLDSIDMSGWSASEKAQLLAYLPFTPETWRRAALLLQHDEDLYWTKANANPYEGLEEINFAIDHLLAVDRVREAIGCIERIVYEKLPFDPPQVVRALRAISSSYGEITHHDSFAIVQIIKALQDSSVTDPSDILKIEWEFLPLLDADYGTSPKFLEQKLADDSDFFCELIRLVFRSDKQEKPPQKSSDEHQSNVTNAYRLLLKWQMPPGTVKDGDFNGYALKSWLDRVKDSCAKSGHLDVALQRVGHVLRYAPPDPDGLWIHQSVAEVLSAKDASQIRKGFYVEIFNSRGAYAVDPEGKPERELAQSNRNKAEQVEARGYHRLATTLREVAASYDREAEQNVLSAHLEN